MPDPSPTDHNYLRWVAPRRAEADALHGVPAATKVARNWPFPYPAQPFDPARY